MRREWVLGTAVASVVAVSALAGCDGGDDAATTTTPVPQTAASTQPAEPMAESVTTIASTTTTPATATTAPSTTTEPTTTLPAETVPPPTDPPTSTTLPDGVPPRLTFPDDPDKQAVVDAAYAFYDAANAAARNPTDTALRSDLALHAGEPIRTRLWDFMGQLAAADERVVGDPRTRLDIYEFTVEVTADSATFDACSVDADVRVRATADGDLTTDDAQVSWNQTYQLAWVDGRWRVVDIVRFASFEGQLGCDAS